MKKRLLEEFGLCEMSSKCSRCTSKSESCEVPDWVLKDGDGEFYKLKGNGSKEWLMFDVIFGWITHDELFELRQRHPRIAP